jgi:hypothetical protein
MKKITISLTVISLFLFSCGNNPNEKSIEQSETVTIEEDHHHNDENEAIVLNNGERWKVDENMLLHIRNMESDCSDFSKNEPKNYGTLAGKLQTNIDLLTSNCTMTGQAHDELHKWLLPYIDLVAELSDANAETEAAKQFEYIQNSFLTFNQYFK